MCMGKAEILGDREAYSPELVRRVTGREPGDTRPMLRETATLRKMFNEALELGFVGSDCEIQQGSIQLDYVDTKKLKRGYAPQEFVVNFEADYTVTENTGVFIHETYGQGATRISKWGDWDRYLNETMKPL